MAGYIGTKSVSLSTDAATISGDITVSGTVDGRDVAADGVTADAALPKAGGTMTGDITRGGTVIQDGTITDTGDFTLDAAGRVILSADDNGEIRLQDGASIYGQFKDDDDRFKIQSMISNKAMLLVGNDNGAEVTALQLDMENAGAATFNSHVTIGGNVDITGTASVDGDLTISNRIFHAGDTDTYFQFETANTARFVIGGAENVRYNTTGTVFNEDSNNLDFRVESNGNANMLFVDGGNDTVAIGTSDTNFDPVADNLIVGTGSGSNGITIYTGSSAGNKGSIFFADTAAGDATNSRKGQITYEQNNEIMTFFTADTERMRLDIAGSLFIGKTGEIGTQDGFQFKQSGECIVARGANDTMFIFQDSNNGGAQVGSISMTGSSTSYNTSSDYRLKENVVYDWDATTRLKQLKPARFNFIADANKTVDGFLAHEAQAVVPECVSGIKDAMRNEKYEVTPAVLDENGTETTAAVMGTRSLDVPDYQGIDQSKIVPLLVKTIQELEARITALEDV